MKVLLTGADGQLGRAFNELLKNEKEVVLINTVRKRKGTEYLFSGKIIEMNISDSKMVNQVIETEKPDVIINCAAFTKVDLCESEQETAEQVNAGGPENLAKAAEAIGAKYVQVSTDYVFDGEGNHPYVEEDTTAPATVYGKTKLAGEEAALKYCKKTFVVRTAWLYGDGANFLRTMLCLAEKNKEVRVVNDQIGTPTTAMELARMIWHLIQTEKYGIYHGSCEGAASWYEFAVEIFKKFGCDVKVNPITTKEYPTPAKRPKYSVLENRHLKEETGYQMKDWKEALDEYVEWYKEKREVI